MTDWIDVASEGDLFEGAGVPVTHEGREIALFWLDGQVFATDNLCTHGDARLCDGFVEGHEVECPFHQARFDLRTGQPTCGPAIDPVRTWPVRIENHRVLVQLPPEE